MAQARTTGLDLGFSHAENSTHDTSSSKRSDPLDQEFKLWAQFHAICTGDCQKKPRTVTAEVLWARKVNALFGDSSLGGKQVKRGG